MGYLRIGSEQGTIFPKDRCVVSFDGTHIGYTLKGKPTADPVLVLCAGYCCPDNFWKYLVPSLSKRFRVLIWNYRGCGVSGMPREPGYRARRYTVEDFGLDRYARDLAMILDQEKIDDVVLIGHSMGTQVALETYRLMPDRVRALVSITGPYASAIQTLYNSAFSPRVYGIVREVLSKVPPARPVWRALFRSPITHPLAQRFGALGPDTKADDMKPYYDHMADMDPSVMLKMAEAMHQHSAEDLLPKVAVPSLIIVGEEDNFVPPWIGHVMASRIPVAELVQIEGGTHGAILEHPRTVNSLVLDFLERNLHGKAVHLAPDRARAPSRATMQTARTSRRVR